MYVKYSLIMFNIIPCMIEHLCGFKGGINSLSCTFVKKDDEFFASEKKLSFYGNVFKKTDKSLLR